MGMGLYDLLGWGVLHPPRLEADPGEAGWALACVLSDSLGELGLRSSYETEPDYLVVPLAVSDPFLQDYWKLDPLPRSTPRVDARTALHIALPPDILLGLARARGIDLAEVWRAAQQLCRQAGLRLPAAGAIVLSDWD